MNNFSLWNLLHGAKLSDVMFKGGKLGRSVAGGGRLPKGYTELEYIENTDGTKQCYITLDQKYTSTKTTVDLYYQYINSPSRRFFGMRNSAAFNAEVSVCGDYVYLFKQHVGTTEGVVFSDELHRLQITKDKVLFDGVEKLEITDEVKTTGYNLSIGATFNKTSLDSSAVGRFGEFIIGEDEVTLFDLVPCKRDSDGLCGFYDIVNDEFRPSEGADDWTEPTLALLVSAPEDPNTQE